MKIAIINQPPGVVDRQRLAGSIAILTYNIAAQLRSQFQVVVFAAKGVGQPRSELDEGILYCRLGLWPDEQLLRVLRKFDGFRAPDKPWLSSRMFYLVYLLKIALAARRQRCAAIHVMNYVQFVSVLRLFNPQAKIVLHMSCEWLTQLSPVIVAKHLTKVDAVVSCSDFVTREIQATFPAFAHKCRTIFNGVSLPAPSKNGRADSNGRGGRVLFVGRISPEKGVHILLEAFEMLLARRPEAELLLVGPRRQLPLEYLVQLSRDERVQRLRAFYQGHNRRAYSRQLEDFSARRLAGRARFLGSLPSQDIQRYYDDTDVLVQPSFTEALGITVLEAFASGVPVIGSNVGGIPELVRNGETGYLCEVGDVEALAESLGKILSSRKERARLGRNARQRIQDEFTWKKLGQEWIHLYQRLAA